MEEIIVLTFASTHRALQAEKVFQSREIPCVTIPVPRQISAGCGLALRFAVTQEAVVQAVVASGAVEVQGLHYLRR